MTDLALEINKHNDAVRRNSRDRIRYRTVCTGCTESELLAPHELRRRQLRYVVGNHVILAQLWLARWRCCHCGRRFTDSPDFRTPLQAICDSLSACSRQGLPGELPCHLSRSSAPRSPADWLSPRCSDNTL